MRRTPRIYCLILAALLLGLSYSQIKASPLWRNLEPGSYRVGYKTILTHDLSRPSISRDATGREIRSAHQGRQMQIGVWYPTAKTSSRPFMQFEDYVYLLAQELDFSPLTQNQRREAIASFMKEPLSRGVSEAQLQRLKKLKTGAIKNARRNLQ